MCAIFVHLRETHAINNTAICIFIFWVEVSKKGLSPKCRMWLPYFKHPRHTAGVSQHYKLLYSNCTTLLAVLRLPTSLVHIYLGPIFKINSNLFRSAAAGTTMFQYIYSVRKSPAATLTP